MEIEFNVDVIIKAKRLNISQAALACGLTYPTMYSVVKNRQALVALQTISRLAEGLDVPVSSLFRVKKVAPPASTDGAITEQVGEQEK